MTLARVPLKSRFGRRLLLLFVGCALVPIAVVGAVSYVHVTRELRTQSQRRLDQTSKALGLAIYERLLLLDATIKSIPPQVLARLPGHGGPARPSPPLGAWPPAHGHASPRPPASPGDRDERVLLTTGLDLLARQRFVALEFVGDDGRRTPVFGTLRERPRTSRDAERDLRLGLPLLLSTQGPQRTGRTFLLRRVEPHGAPHGTLIGEVSPQFLWAMVDASMPSPWTTVSIVDDSGHAVFRSTAMNLAAAYDPLGEVPPELAETVSSIAPADSTGAPFVSASWPIPLDEVFSAPEWTLVLSESRDQVLGPIARFSEIIFWVVLLSGTAVLAISARQIRRSIVPLAELQEGTRRIAQRDFTSRVAVSSLDEFEELAGSFNAMAAQLDRQFQALSTAAEIDRAVLSATDAAAIVDTLLARMPDVFPCHLLWVTIMAPDGTKSLSGVVHDYDDATRHPTRVEFRADDVQDLLDGPEVVLRDAVREVPAYLAPLARLGPRSIVVLPLRFRRQLVGVLALGDRNPTPPPLADHVQVRRLADQVAVALANARMIEQVRTLAYYDSLTGLPNRLSYKERLARALTEARARRERVGAFFIDLDHFSRINDTLGHEAGDQLLQHVAQRLRASCREREDQVGPAYDAVPDVARLGGDEFTVIMPGLADPQDAAKLARRILSALAHPIRVADQEIFINASIGIAVFPDDAEDLETLLMHADTAMYQAKRQGGSSYQAFARAMNATALQRLTLENSLRRAVDRAEFVLHYQPIVDARTGRVVGAEALVRWRHPELGLLLPSEFVPLAEENGLIGPLGEWVLRTACQQNRDWQTAGLPPVRVVVNLSSRQLDRGLAEHVARVLHTTGLDARYLGLELTESVLAAHQQEDTAILHALRAMGLHLAVDDFGTGFSSFGYLKHFPLDALKIDRTFVREIATSPDDAAITTAIIAMAHALGLKVVGEGVETDAQQAVLRKQGCDELQGYLFSRPVTPGEFAELLARRATAPKVRRLRSA